MPDQTVADAPTAAESHANGVRPASEIPGPRTPRLLNSLIGVYQPVRARLDARKRFGPIYRVHDSILGDVVTLADPELVGTLFKGDAETFHVGEPRAVMEPVTGMHSILLLDEDRHLRMRKLMLPPFHGEAIERYGELIEQITNREIDRWQIGATIRTRTVAQTITMEVIIRAVFGITDRERVAELKTLLPALSGVNPLLALDIVRHDLGRHSPWGSFLRTRTRVDEILYEEIERRRGEADLEERDDMLSLLLAARDEEGNPLTDIELRDELITLLLAGHETTANSIGWTFERVLRTPSALERLTEEVRAGESTEYMDAVIKEALRVRPVIMEVERGVTKPFELGGYRFEPGAQLAASIILLHYDPELYGADAQEFRPERFLEGAPEPYTWIPFGGGRRRCLGATFAQYEMKVVISTILKRAVLRAASPKPEKLRFRGIALVPARGGEAIVESVDGRASGDWRSQVLPVRSDDSGKVARTYSRLAPVYEVWAKFTESKPRRRVTELADVHDGESILEVAVGTGVQLCELARRNPNGTTAGVDLSKGMLAKTRRTLARANIANVDLREASGLELPFADDSFDLLVNGYMLDLLTYDDIARAIAEFKRVLKPGGRILLTNMTIGEKPHHRIWDRLYERGIDLTANCRGVLAAPVLEELGFADIERQYMAQGSFPTEIVTAHLDG
ncbi:MAG: cytochrome P450 [Solirubrobacterales bacterium]